MNRCFGRCEIQTRACGAVGVRRSYRRCSSRVGVERAARRHGTHGWLTPVIPEREWLFRPSVVTWKWASRLSLQRSDDRTLKRAVAYMRQAKRRGRTGESVWKQSEGDCDGRPQIGASPLKGHRDGVEGQGTASHWQTKWKGKWKCIRVQMRLMKNDFSIVPCLASNVWH